MKAGKHAREAERLAALQQHDILDTPREAAFDDIVALLARLCEAPVAVINLIDSDRQWFKAEIGLGVRSTPLETSLCAHVILETDFVEIEDTLTDARMCDNPLCVADDGFRFYAGALLKTSQGLPIGTLCVLDRQPRRLTPLQRDTIEVLASHVMRQIELRTALRREDLMRREVDHRVKNSLQTIASIISLQSSQHGGASGEGGLSGLTNRLQAIIAFHEELHQDRSGDHIDLADYLPRLALHQNVICPDGISVAATSDSALLLPDAANSIGTIINEFVANSIKHGYHAGGSGVITIEGRRSGQTLQLRCLDGSGRAADLAAFHPGAKGLGLRIIAAAAASIGASSRWSNEAGGLMLTIEMALAT